MGSPAKGGASIRLEVSKTTAFRNFRPPVSAFISAKLDLYRPKRHNNVPGD